MSVARAILGRFARFLVRVARRLDPQAAGTPYWVIPERMAALRQRYPGAPEQWLEVLARRATVLDGADVPAYRTQPEPRPAAARPGFAPGDQAARRELSIRESARPAARPEPRFPQPRARVAIAHRPPGRSGATRPPAQPTQSATSRRRPSITFGTPHVRNPIANLLRGEAPKERPPSPEFAREQRTHHADDAPLPWIDQRSEHFVHFPEAEIVAGRDVEWPLSRPTAHHPPVDLTWPEFRYSAPPGPSWPNENLRPRPDPRFAAPDNRWPELPALIEQTEPSIPGGGDETSLRAEQIGGTWSA